MAEGGKTVFDPDATVAEDGKTKYESDATVCEQDATACEGKGDTVPDKGAPAPSGASAPSDGATFEKGSTILDTYRVESNPIHGGMGSVWRVHHTGWNVGLAMKRPQPKCFATEKSKADFMHECEAWINLGLHPNIVSCYYVREISGTPSIFSEWMDGGSLESAIQKGTLYEGTEAEQRERILDIAIQFARGLHYAHEAGLIHQDVKPDNLLLTKEGDAKVADFGLARARAVLTVAESTINVQEAADSGKTIASPSGGYTPAYCSMEQMDGKELTRRTDIYSWAVSVMEMCAGSRPWANGVVAGLSCESYLADTRVPVSPKLRTLLIKCMASEPDDRPHDFAQIETELLAIYRAETGRDYFRPAPKAAADTADSLNNRALSYLDLGRQKDAEKCWERALAVAPWHEASNFNRELYYARFSTKGFDADKFSARMKDNVPAWRIHYWTGLIQTERHDYFSAIETLEKAVEEDDNREVRAALRQAEALQGEPVVQEPMGVGFTAFSADGVYVLAWNKSFASRIRLRDRHMEQVEIDKKTPLGRQGCLSSDGAVFFAFNPHEPGQAYSMPDGKCLGVFGTPEGKYEDLMRAGVSPDGRYLYTINCPKLNGASPTMIGLMRLWSLPSGRLLLTRQNVYFSPVFSEDSRYLALVELGQHGTQAISLPEGDPAGFFPGKEMFGSVLDLVHVSHSEEPGAAISGDGKLWLKKLSSPCQPKLQGFEQTVIRIDGTVFSSAWQKDGRTLVSFVTMRLSGKGEISVYAYGPEAMEHREEYTLCRIATTVELNEQELRVMRLLREALTDAAEGRFKQAREKADKARAMPGSQCDEYFALMRMLGAKYGFGDVLTQWPRRIALPEPAQRLWCADDALMVAGKDGIYRVALADMAAQKLPVAVDGSEPLDYDPARDLWLVKTGTALTLRDGNDTILQTYSMPEGSPEAACFAGKKLLVLSMKRSGDWAMLSEGRLSGNRLDTLCDSIGMSMQQVRTGFAGVPMMNMPGARGAVQHPLSVGALSATPDGKHYLICLQARQQGDSATVPTSRSVYIGTLGKRVQGKELTQPKRIDIIHLGNGRKTKSKLEVNGQARFINNDTLAVGNCLWRMKNLGKQKFRLTLHNGSTLLGFLKKDSLLAADLSSGKFHIFQVRNYLFSEYNGSARYSFQTGFPVRYAEILPDQSGVALIDGDGNLWLVEFDRALRK